MPQRRYSERLALSNRKREQRRRKSAVIAAVALAGVLAVGGTVAWIFDRTDEVENTFQPVEVTCKVNETVTGNTKSDVRVINTGDVDAYIRAAVVVNWAKQADDGSIEIYPEAPAAGDYAITYDRGADGGGTAWAQEGDYWYYTLPVKPAESTANLILSCSPVEGKAPEGYSLYVEILSSAIQSEPAGAVQEAWGVSISSGAVTSVSQGN